MVPIYILKLFFLLKIKKSNILNIKGLANGYEKTSVQVDFFGKYYDLPFLQPFSRYLSGYLKHISFPENKFLYLPKDPPKSKKVDCQVDPITLLLVV